ncbi:TPA: FAD-dependent thymidylate synthase [Candidatus Campbellbacteria bacterium]|nr:MAG: thymidylate synthase complementing protein ThyX, thymidylate synthase (FAD) [Candidatus Campbellbacteria bacterium GW2011_OD1_34_28]KKP75209.1 MAG: Thymidylate synthase complementing protein ThyX [Candidatus Campbellbacteria bacterium GW2011_GWD2_35_24]KKP76230.1 MAG: thymidylate synthase complementing protein ThyX, thymidylate synthase (FAD) [Candidatus Campbellbacteria bacterium GW2011_GWC2_35_28]KKP77419.1 MAG: Thymidylate synthase complementing protein ThyX [Candidatus Campbellbacter
MRNLLVVPPSSEILPDDLGLAQRIEYTGRICYKSEDKITPDSSAGFCRDMTGHKHNSVLEMAVRSYWFNINSYPYMNEILKSIPKYLIIDEVGIGEWFITGSVRAFREMFMWFPDNAIFQAIAFDINKSHPYFFEDLKKILPESAPANVSYRQIPLEEIDQMSTTIQARHRHVAVKFIVNRAVTHEIVRHRPCAFLQESQRYCRYGSGKFGDRVTFIKPMFFKEDSEGYRLWEQAMLETERIYLDLVNMKDENGKNLYTAQAARTVLPNSCKTELFLYAPLTEWHHILHMRTSKAAEPSMREVMVPLQQEFITRWPNQNFGEPLRMPEGHVVQR